MWRFLFAVILVVACVTVAAAGPIEDAESAIQHEDYTLAARLFRPLAEQGNAKAQVMLGIMYDFGQGVPQDFLLAHMWLNVGAAAMNGEAGNAAMKSRDHVASQMTPEQIVKAQAMARRCIRSKFKECD